MVIVVPSMDAKFRYGRDAGGNVDLYKLRQVV